MKELATASGYRGETLTSLQKCSHFKKTHNFIIQSWEAIFMHMLQICLASNPRMSALIQELITESRSASSVTVMFHEMRETVCEVYQQFKGFVHIKAENDPNWKFWDAYVAQNAFSYIALFASIRSGNWNLRLASLKLMAPIFSAFDRPTYRKLLPQHLADCLLLPTIIQDTFVKGGFVVSITGQPWHSVGIDEAHEMLVNRDCKMAVVHSNKEFISRMALYFPYRTKLMRNFKEQVNTKYTAASEYKHETPKAKHNVHAMLELLQRSDTLPAEHLETAVLRNGFTGNKADPSQQADLINFRQIGQNDFDAYVEHVYLRTGNTKSSVKRNRLKTSKTVTKHQYTRLQKEKKHVTNCLKKRLLHCQITNADTVPHEQYLELPRALADSNGIPQKGQKSTVTSFSQTKYGEKVISNTFPPGWLPNSVILEGMFLINTTPLRTHSSMLEYTTFLLSRYAGWYLKAGVDEVHIVFDDPGRFDMHPKDIERSRRDADKPTTHEHIQFHDQTKIPNRWRDLLACRKCKRELVVYIGDCFLRIAPTYLKEHQKLVVGGASDTLERDQAWSITENALEHIETCYRSNAEEADTLVWLHATHSAGRRKLIFSPDTDVYHIGLTCAELASTNTIVQLSALGRELRLLNLNELDNALKLDPDLHTLIPERRREILQVIYVTTGCDFTSFFSGIGKVAFLKAFYCYSKFITTPGEHTPGSLTDISPESHGFLSFIRLVGVAYFIKHKPAFAAETPSSQFQGFYAPGANSEEHHMQWYNGIRSCIWERIPFEEHLPPSFEALNLHWLRSLWVIDYWRQANQNTMTLLPMDWFGWVITSGQLQLEWDSPENIQRTRNSVAFLTHGCGCKTGCRTCRCKCVKAGQHCGPGCGCSRTECQNKATSSEGIVYITQTHITYIHYTLDHGEIEPERCENETDSDSDSYDNTVYTAMEDEVNVTLVYDFQ